jgi:hypothetical protein
MGLSLTPATDMQSRIRTGLLSRGMAPHIADAFIMNFKDESGLNPGINEIAPTVPGSRGGFGLYQLTGPRRVAYEQFAKERGANPADVDAQLDFMMMELQGPESRAAKSIFAAPDTGSAAAAIVTNFLRPAEQHRNSRVAKYQGGGPQSQPQGLMETFSTRSSPQTEAPMQPEKATGLLGSLFPNMTADRQDRLAMGLSGLSMFPNQGVMQGAQQRMGERREDRKEAKGQASAQQQANLTARWLAQQPGGEQIAQGIASGAFSGDQGLTMYRGVSQAQNNPNVQSSQMLPDMTGTVMTMRDGSVSVVTSGGETLSGQAAMDFIRNSNESYTNQQRDIYGARREGQLGADISLGGEAARVEAEGKQAPITAKEFGQQASLIRSSIGNMTDAISAIDRGANSGIVYKMLPAIGEASASLRNATNRLGLDVIGSVTFGALSLAEMQLAMETAVPQNLSPQDLREWLVRKQAAQQKAYQATMEAAQHFSSGGTQEEYYRMIGADQTRAATQPANTSSGATHRFNPETGQVEPIR